MRKLAFLSSGLELFMKLQPYGGAMDRSTTEFAKSRMSRGLLAAARGSDRPQQAMAIVPGGLNEYLAATITNALFLAHIQSYARVQRRQRKAFPQYRK